MFSGQNYGGTQEVLLTAPLFLVTGTSAWALRAVPFLLVAVTAVLVWRIGSADVQPRFGDRSSGPLLGRAGLPHLQDEPSARVLRVRARVGGGDPPPRASPRRARLPTGHVLLGLALGLAWWQTPQIVTVAVPAIAWLVWYRPAVIRHGWPVVPAALIGMAPWIVWNAGHQWSSVTDPPGSAEPMTLRSYVDHVRAYVSSLMPMNLGLRTPFTAGWPLGKIAAGLIYAALLIAFARLGWRRRRQPISLLVVVTIAYPLMYALSPAAWNANEPRYALLSLPALAVLLAYPLRTPEGRCRSGRRRRPHGTRVDAHGSPRRGHARRRQSPPLRVAHRRARPERGGQGLRRLLDCVPADIRDRRAHHRRPVQPRPAKSPRPSGTGDAAESRDGRGTGPTTALSTAPTARRSSSPVRTRSRRADRECSSSMATGARPVGPFVVYLPPGVSAPVTDPARRSDTSSEIGCATLAPRVAARARQPSGSFPPGRLSGRGSSCGSYFGPRTRRMGRPAGTGMSSLRGLRRPSR